MLLVKAEGRIQQYINFLEQRSYRNILDLDFEVYETAESLREPPEGVSWQPAPARPGAAYPWGREWCCSWFRANFTAPSGGRPLFLSVTPNADSLAFIDGVPAGAFNPFHRRLRIKRDGREHSLHVEAYGGHFYGGEHPFMQDEVILTLSCRIPKYPNSFEGGALVERIEPVYALYYDVRALFETAKTLDDNSLRRARIIKGLYDALMEIPFAGPDDELEEKAVAAKLRIGPLLQEKNSNTTPKIYLTGHAHIDHAWLWHLGETARKVARTYRNMTALAEEYPEFSFVQSQAAQLEMVEREYPSVFAEVRRAYANGNWEPNGGMWVEADCNITGGESLIRQFLVGKQTVEKLLGYEGDTLWLPDVFGYAAALPQILAGCRIKYFVTSKISWNDTTRFPYDSFLWRGIDGTGIKTHFLADRAEGYNGRVSPAGLWQNWKDIQHKELISGALKAIGEGDGGGGTTRGDLEGTPRSAWGRVSGALDAIFGGATELPEWQGELYLELHRGTYTTQARTKRYNRRLEFLLRQVEFLSAVSALERGRPYPYTALRSCWKTVLTNQFHDIIPGSSIGRVYAEAEAAYAEAERALAGLSTEAMKQLAGGDTGDVKAGGSIGFFNTLSWERRAPLTWAPQADQKAAFIRNGGGGYPVQYYTDLDGNRTAVTCPVLMPMGWAGFEFAEAGGPAMSPVATAFSYRAEGPGGAGSLETPFYKLGFDEAGRISSLFDLRQNRELVAPGGCLNRLIGAEDIPVIWEAWDIDADWTKKAVDEDRLLSTEIAAEGPVCFRLRRVYQIGRASHLVQDTVFYAEDPRIDFESKIDWREKERLLKAGFETAIHTTQARCEVQYGHLFRPIHRNLPQDRARFEFCAHKWVSLEEAGGGLAVLNDCKYGWDAAVQAGGSRLRLTLLRSPIAPDRTADQGEHRFTYSLLPFAGTFGGAGVIRAGYELNAPAPASGGSNTVSAAFSLCTLDNPAVIVECVKAPEPQAKPEKGIPGKGLVLRLYESLGGRTAAKLRFARPLVSVWETDMLEKPGTALPVSGGELSLEFRAFEIKTLLLEFA
ncbi:MAG: glycosyl hydrolase-related protein [Treponema sp.]|jgi:alpha-mannosidase|nr:glycosyl hydrolase-related protein [Treponema sp.]